MAKLLRDRYFWLISVIVTLYLLFMWGHLFGTLGWLTLVHEEWEQSFMLIVHILFLLGVVLAAWRFGFKVGMAAWLVLAAPLLANTLEMIEHTGKPDSISVLLFVLVIAILISWLTDIQVKKGRLLLEAHQQLQQDVIARVRAEEESRRTEEQFLQLQKTEALGRLASGISHDFSHVLTGILGYCELLLASIDGSDSRRGDVEEIRKAGKRGEALVQQLLAFSRQQPLEKKTINLNSIITDMNNMLERVIAKDIEIVTMLEPELELVDAVSGQVEQIIINFAVNARDAMLEGGKLISQTSNVVIDDDYCRAATEARPGKFVCITVTDTGVGISKDVIEQIFEPFFTTKGSGRTGLGLSTINGIVKQHGGWIDVSSEVGQGSSFSVYFKALPVYP